MKQMSYSAWAYIWGVLVAGLVLSVLAFARFVPATMHWQTFVTFTLLAVGAQLFEAVAPNRHSYYPSFVFFFAGVLLLPPALFVLMVVVTHLVEWAKARLVKSTKLRNWYIQPFNMAMHIIAGVTARWMHSLFHADLGLFPLISPVVTVTLVALSYVVINNVLLGLVLSLARGISWRDSGVLDLENLLSELIMLCLGYVVAVLWEINHWLILPALSPLGLMYRALQVPQLKEEARTDGKTGLWNARHFNTLFQAELERATRFNRPVAFIMADLDLLRDINNTYGHLAGDTVLTGIGTLLRGTIRDYDIAGRFGGEEFAIAMPEVGPVEAGALAERIRQAIQAARFEVATSPTPISVTMSFGVACFPLDATSATELIHEADAAVYQAKHQGRNRVVRASDVPVSVKLALEHDRSAEANASCAAPDGTDQAAATEASTRAALPSALPVVTARGWVQELRALLEGRFSRSLSSVPQRLSMTSLLWCAVAVCLGLAFQLYGLLGMALIAPLLLLLCYAQRQALAQTELSTHELLRSQQQLLHSNQALATSEERLQQANGELLELLASALDARHPAQGRHAARVAESATVVAVELGLAPVRVAQVRQAALLHDLGTIRVAEQVLHKPGPLTEAEYDQVRLHVISGADTLEASQGLRHLAPFVRHHHERWDGTGYPSGLCGGQIPFEARILAVCEAVETLVSPQPYRAALPLAAALAEMERCAGSQFDPEVVAALSRVAARYGGQLFEAAAHSPSAPTSDLTTTAQHEPDHAIVLR